MPHAPQGADGGTGGAEAGDVEEHPREIVTGKAGDIAAT
jgi:hypothetical protein